MDFSTANEDQIDKAKEIVKKLRFRYSSEAFENPVLQKHYANVEAMALDRDQPEDIDDKSRECIHFSHICYSLERSGGPNSDAKLCSWGSHHSRG